MRLRKPTRNHRCAKLHSSQARKSGEADAAEIGDCGLAADRGEIAEVGVAERIRQARPPSRPLISLAT